MQLKIYGVNNLKIGDFIAVPEQVTIMRKRLRKRRFDDRLIAGQTVDINRIANRIYLKSQFAKAAQISFLEFVDLSDWDLSFIIGNFGNVIRYLKDGVNLYFKECKTHLDGHGTLMRGTEAFFEQVHPEAPEAIKEIVLKGVKEKEIAHRLLTMGVRRDKGSRLAKYHDSLDPSVFGFKGIQGGHVSIFTEYINYIFAELNLFEMHLSARRDELETAMAGHALATISLAKVLGFDGLIPNAKAVQVKDKFETRYGILMEEAIGRSWDELPFGFEMTESLARDCHRLQLLHYLNHDNDFKQDNVRLVEDGGKYVGLTVFDIDGPDTFLSTTRKAKNIIGCINPLDCLSKYGPCVIEKEDAERVASLTEEDLLPVKPYLNAIQFKYLVKRSHILARAARTAEEYNSSCRFSLGDELIGCYGKTYLAALAKH